MTRTLVQSPVVHHISVAIFGSSRLMLLTKSTETMDEKATILKIFLSSTGGLAHVSEARPSKRAYPTNADMLPCGKTSLKKDMSQTTKKHHFSTPFTR